MAGQGVEMDFPFCLRHPREETITSSPIVLFDISTRSVNIRNVFCSEKELAYQVNCREYRVNKMAVGYVNPHWAIGLHAIAAGSLFCIFKPFVCVICFEWAKTYAKTALPEHHEDQTTMNSSYRSVSGSIEEKITWAAEIYQTFGRHLLEDKKLADFLEKIRHASQASQEKMMETGISALCMQCDQDEGGSCCGAGLENRYDGWLILINLLLNVDIPRKRRDSRSCFFLGENGCLLQVRHVICINYICKKITDRIEPARINALREKEGEEVSLLFLLNEYVKKLLKRQPGYHGRETGKEP